MKLEIEIDLNDKSKVTAFILFLQACNGAVVGTVETTLEAKVEAPKKTAKKAVDKLAEVEKAEQKLENALEEAYPKTEAVEKVLEKSAEAEEDKISLEQIREAFADKVNTGDNRMQLKNELTRLDAPNLVKLDKAHYADFLNFINTL
jgi:hypothetical protein